MRLDVSPRPFETLDDLIHTYIYGSAFVVGYPRARLRRERRRELQTRAGISALACHRVATDELFIDD